MASVADRARNRAEGIQLRHARKCPSRRGEACSCTPTYQAQVWSARDGKPIRKTFLNVSEAKAWRSGSQVALRKRTLRAPSAIRLTEAADEWLTAAEAGIIRTRSGDHYKPSALRSYRQALKGCALPQLGHLRLTAVSQNTIQDLADRLSAEGAAPSTIRNMILPLRAIYRRAAARGEIAVNPTLNSSSSLGGPWQRQHAACCRCHGDLPRVQALRNASRSALNLSLCVAVRPCGAPP